MLGIVRWIDQSCWCYRFSAIASFPVRIKTKKQRTVQVSFAPTTPGEWDTQLVLRILQYSEGKRVTLAITRRLHGVATSKPGSLTPQKPGDIKGTPGVRARQRHPGSSKNMQLQSSKQHRRSATLDGIAPDRTNYSAVEVSTLLAVF